MSTSNNINKSNPNSIINNKNNSITSINEKQDSNNTDNPPSKSTTKIITLIINENSQMKIDLKLAVKGYPNILSILNLDTCELQLPDWIDIKSLKDYFTYVKLSYATNEAEINGSTSEMNFNFKKLIQLVNFFENEIILEHTIKMNIIPNISIENSVNLLNDTFAYYLAAKKKGMKNLWAGIIEILTNFIEENFQIFLNEINNIKLKKLNKNLLENIVNSYLCSQKEELTQNNKIKIIHLLGFIYDIHTEYENGSLNEEIYFKLFTILNEKNEDLDQEKFLEKYNSILSYEISLDNFFENTDYQENSTIFQNYNLSFITKYDKSLDELNLYIKYTSSTRNIEINQLFFYSSVISENTHTKWNSNLICQNEKINLFKIRYYSQQKQYNKLNILVKLNNIETFLINYLIDNFSVLGKNKLIQKIPDIIYINVISYFIFIQKNKNEIKEDTLITSIIHWRKYNI